MVSIVILINGQKKLIPLTSDVGSGVPLGTLVAFSDDLPKDGYVQMGTTFDETKYPMLFAMRGSNVLPAMFDHSRPSEWKEILPFATHTISSTFPYTATKDGIYSLLITTGENRIVTVNGVEVGRPSTQARNNITFLANKGDIIGVSGTGSPEFGFTAAYFEHPLFIKATSGLAENQQENVLNTLNNNLSYSTEEHATGIRWINGKMIYQCCKYIYQNSVVAQGVTAESGNLYSGNVLPSNIDEIVDYHVISKRPDNYVDNFAGQGSSVTINFVPNISTSKVYFNAGGYTPVYSLATYFYTKTT